MNPQANCIECMYSYAVTRLFKRDLASNFSNSDSSTEEKYTNNHVSAGKLHFRQGRVIRVTMATFQFVIKTSLATDFYSRMPTSNN
jgi:hypothetical protein